LRKNQPHKPVEEKDVAELLAGMKGDAYCRPHALSVVGSDWLSKTNAAVKMKARSAEQVRPQLFAIGY